MDEFEMHKATHTAPLPWLEMIAGTRRRSMRSPWCACPVSSINKYTPSFLLANLKVS